MCDPVTLSGLLLPSAGRWSASVDDGGPRGPQPWAGQRKRVNKRGGVVRKTDPRVTYCAKYTFTIVFLQ